MEIFSQVEGKRDAAHVRRHYKCIQGKNSKNTGKPKNNDVFPQLATEYH